jgi:hypothetical protein
VTVQPRWITGTALTVYGLGLLVFGDQYTAPGFHIVFELAPKWVWGALFVVAGVLMVWRRTPATIAVAATVLGTWAIGLGIAVITGDSQSATAFVWPLCLTVHMVSGTGKGG